MTSKQKNIGLLILGAILLFSFTYKKKTKGSLIINPNIPTNLFSLPGSELYNYSGDLVYMFVDNEYLAPISEDLNNYFVSYIKPDGTEIQGYIKKTEIVIK